MIQVSVNDGKCDCVIDGDPRALAAELVQAENAVMEQVGKRGIVEAVVFNIVYHAIEQTIADAASDRATRKCNCDRREDSNDEKRD